MARARATAEAIAAGRGLAVETDPRWRELEFGAWEGLTWDEIVARFPEATASPSVAGAFKFVTPRGGESFDSACVRVGVALGDLRAKFAGGGSAVVVTHAGALHALLRIALGEAEAGALKVRFAPASVTRLEFGEGRPRLLALNETVTADEVA